MKRILFAAIAVAVAVILAVWKFRAEAEQPVVPSSDAAAAQTADAPAQLAGGSAAEPARVLPSPDRPTVPDQLELRTKIAEADTRLMSALDAAYERELAEGRAIEGWIDEAGTVQHSTPLPPEPRLLRQLDLPEEPKPEAGAEGKRDEGPGAPKRVRTLVLTMANAPEVFALQDELAALRRQLR